jgi:prepilin-type N-terminal cleavage/methylation domain-containing protein
MNRNNAPARMRRGFSLIELLIVVAIILIIASVAIPKMNKTMMQAREMTTIRQINTIHTGQTQYRSQFGHYAANLAELGPPGQSGKPAVAPFS